jgi:hypothetical protein
MSSMLNLDQPTPVAAPAPTRVQPSNLSFEWVFFTTGKFMAAGVVWGLLLIPVILILRGCVDFVINK